MAIVLAAEFHRWKVISNTRLRVRDADKWDPTVRKLLSNLGVFELVNLHPVTTERADENYTLTPLISGEKATGHKMALLQEQFKQVLNGFTTNPQMYAGLVEAAENAVVHAYPSDFVSPYPLAGDRWWAASCLDLSRMALRFFVFDQGAGIPHTLPAINWYEDVRANLALLTGDLIPNDSLMLKAALEVGRTRTFLDHRGLGLQRMSNVVTGAKDGYLRILSGKGEIVYHADQTLTTSDHDRHIGGTLIEWSMSADLFTSYQGQTDEDD